MRIPEKIGKYKLISELGAGAMGVVFKAQQEFINRIVAIKLLPQDSANQDPQLVQRFRTEALAAAKVIHPNLVTVYDVGKDVGFHYIAMEFVNGKPLDADLWKDGWSPVDMIGFLAQASGAIAAAHRVSIVHRDIKPKNIMVENEGITKVLDFGIARVEGGQGVTRVGTIMGSPPYMSPEQARGDKVDQRTDIFSFGVVMYEVLSGGTRPFGAPDTRTLILERQKLKAPPPPVSLINPRIPRHVDYVVNKCLYGDAAKRYASADEMADDLQLALYLIDSKKVSCTVLADVVRKAQQTTITIPWKRIFQTLFGGAILFLIGVSVLMPHASIALLLTLLPFPFCYKMLRGFARKPQGTGSPARKATGARGGDR